MSGAADRPIGVFDSGVGGLTVLRELRRQLPNESTIYLGDEARMPYGPREPAEVVGFTREAMRWFAKADCKLVVIACNTATSVALETVRDEFPVPAIGVIRPGAAAALSATARRAVGVLATVLTVRSGAYVRALRDLDPLVDVAQQACPKLVPLVEDGKAESPEALEAVREYVEPLLTEGGVVRPVVDTLLLGCTHYPLLRDAIEKVAGRERTSGGLRNNHGARRARGPRVASTHARRRTCRARALLHGAGRPVPDDRAQDLPRGST